MAPRSQPYRVALPFDAEQASNIDEMFQILFDDVRNGSITVSEDQIILHDVTTDDATTSMHGLLPKLSGNAYDFFSGAGTYLNLYARVAARVSLRM